MKKPQLDNARKLRGIHLIDPEDKEFKETIKNARKKWETPVAPAMLCKTSKTCKHGETRGKPMRSNQNLHVSWKPVNPQDCVWKNLYRIIMRTILQEKGDNSLQRYNLVHKFIPMPQAMKIPATRAAVDKEWEKLEKIPAWDLMKVRSEKEVIDEARTKGAKVHFASLMDICHLKNAELETKHQKYKGRIVLRGDIVKDDPGSPGCAGQAADVVSAFSQGKIEDAPKLLKNPKSVCPDIWIRLPRHTWPKSWSSMEDPVVPLERNLYGHPLAGLLCEWQFEKILVEVRLGEGFQLGMLIRTP